MLTPDELAAMREREQAATPGPWLVKGDELVPVVVLRDPRCHFVRMGGVDLPDMEFIAHAREDIPRLLARIDELDADLVLAQSLGFHRRDA